MRRNGWIVLHYLFFYFMNDYRSTFNGANDHEADWEQVFIYLEDRPDGPRPVWIAGAAHDYIGDELRRRWDDPPLVKEGDHPVIFAGAGSHASYFEQGEYLTRSPCRRCGASGAAERLRDFWRDTLRQPDPGDLAHDASSRPWRCPSWTTRAATALAIGPGQPAEWTPVLIDDATDWVDGYRGLFGLDTHDRFAGERAPAGPKYTAPAPSASPGTTRSASLAWPRWRRPIGCRPSCASASTRSQGIRGGGDGDRAGASAAAARCGSPRAFGRRLDGRVHEARGASSQARRQASHSAPRSPGFETRSGPWRLRSARVELGDHGSPTAHLRHAMHPMPPESARYGRLVEFWSAVSISILLWSRPSCSPGACPWSGTHPRCRRLHAHRGGLPPSSKPLILRVALLLAVLTLAILALTFASQLVIVGVVALALIVLADNVREIRR